MSYRGSMFLVRQGCPYKPHYYRDNNNLDQDTIKQYKDCVKAASPSEVGSGWTYSNNNVCLVKPYQGNKAANSL